MKEPAGSELMQVLVFVSGVIAQLVERPLRMRKAGSSNLPSSIGTLRRSMFLENGGRESWFYWEAARSFAE